MARENLARFTADGREPQSARLRGLLRRAVQGEGELLRLSPRRTVLRLKDETSDWLLKLDAPQRRLEALRAHLRRPPLLREARNWESLRGRWLRLAELVAEVHAEQLDAARGCFARPWLQGRSGGAWSTLDAAAVGAGMAKLHAIGWTDPDLDPADLLLDHHHHLLPLDLGHAHVAIAPTSLAKRTRDLIQLLGGLGSEPRLSLTAPLLEAYRATLELPHSDTQMSSDALAWSCTILRRQSHRCLRRTRDFEPQEDGMMRVEGVIGQAVEKLQGRGTGQGRKVFRLLYELELHGIPALRPTRLQQGGDGTWSIHGRAPQVSAPTSNALRLQLRQSGFDLGGSDGLRQSADGGFYLQDLRALTRISHRNRRLPAPESAKKRQ